MRRLAPLFWLAGMVFLGLACAGMVARGGVVVPGWPAVAAAAVLLCGSLLAGGRGWIALLDGAAPARRLAAGFYAAQLGKYIPGGVWLGAGQVGLAVDAGVPLGRATAALSAYGVCLLCAGAALVGLTGAAAPGLDPWLRAAAPLALLSLVLLDRRWMTRVAGWVGRRIAGAESGVVPGQRGIIVAAGWAALAVLASALAFVAIVAGLGVGPAALPATAAFVLAWLGGYLVIGLPSGIGAREALLVASLGAADATGILAASLAHRLVQMAVETILVLGTRRFRVAAALRPALMTEEPACPRE